MTNLDSIFKSTDIILPTKVRLVKVMVFPVVMFGCATVLFNELITLTVSTTELASRVQGETLTLFS